MGLWGTKDVDKTVTAVASGVGFSLLGVPDNGAVTCTAGSTTLWTPPAGKRGRLRWLSLSSLSDGTECLATVRFGASQTVYLWGLPAPGAFARTSIRESVTADDALVIDLTPSGGPVYVNFEIEPIDVEP